VDGGVGTAGQGASRTSCIAWRRGRRWGRWLMGRLPGLLEIIGAEGVSGQGGKSSHGATEGRRAGMVGSVEFSVISFRFSVVSFQLVRIGAEWRRLESSRSGV